MAIRFLEERVREQPTLKDTAAAALDLRGTNFQIRSTDVFGNYRWGRSRKMAMVGWEVARAG
jgi:hypothetical protein